MGKIRELADRILVMYEPDEIISERIGFKENTVAMLGSAIAFGARKAERHPPGKHSGGCDQGGIQRRLLCRHVVEIERSE